MRFGVLFANVGPFASPEGALAMAQGAEAAGFESIWAVEHVVVPQGYESRYPYSDDGRMPAPDDLDLPDPLVWLSWVAAHTSTLTLGTGILILPQRNPLVTAKEVATLDRLSGGRVVLGVGVGWLEEEFQALGVPFDGRGRRTDDHVAAMRALWEQDVATHDGTDSRFSRVVSRPRPVAGTVPVVVGGHTAAAARRAGRIGDGFFPGRGSHEELAALFELARSTAVEHGRDPARLELTSGGAGALGRRALDEVKALADLGVTRVVIPPLAFDPAGIRDALARYGDEVIARVPA